MRKKPYRPIPLEEFIAGLPKAERDAIDRRTRELMAEELSLQDLRKAMGKTQVAIARRLKVGQDAVSKLETRSDMYLSTLRGFVNAMGGELELIARFPNRPAVRLERIGTIAPPRRKSRRVA